MRNRIERQRNVIDFTLSLLWRRKGKNLALLFVYSAVVFLLASVVLLTDSLKKEASIILQDSPEMIVQRMPGGHHDLIPLVMRRVPTVGSITAVRTGSGAAPRPHRRRPFPLMVSADSSLAPGSVIIGEGVYRVRLAYEGAPWNSGHLMAALSIHRQRLLPGNRR